MTFEEAEKEVRNTDYAIEAANQEENPINWSDAAAFYLEGHKKGRECGCAEQREKDAEIAKDKMRLLDWMENDGDQFGRGWNNACDSISSAIRTAPEEEHDDRG